MGRGDARHSVVSPGRRVRRWGTGLVAAVLVLAGLAYAIDLGPRVLGWDHPSPLTEPAEVAPPPGLSLPSASPAGPVAEVSPQQGADPAAVRRAVAGLLRDKDLGPRVAVAIAALADGDTVYESGPGLVTPASTMKLLTTTAALATLGPDHRFGTTVVAGARSRDVVLVGGGDPLLGRRPDPDGYPARADLATLARQTARSLRELGRSRVRLGYDTSLFSGPEANPAWRQSYITDDVVSPISPLWIDEGRERSDMSERSDDPALAAATEFGRLLGRQGIRVVGAPARATAVAGATQYGAVHGAPLAQVVRWVLEVSDNEAAEVLLRHVAIAEGRAGSAAQGTAAVRNVLGGLGVDTTGARILDGSGLARGNRVAPSTLLSVLELAASREHPELRPVATGLPVAGFTGSLTDRFATGKDEGLGRVRAKTGTLTGVHGLAGTVTDTAGTVLVFVAVADRVRLIDTLDAREQLDKVAAALAACDCAA